MPIPQRLMKERGLGKDAGGRKLTDLQGIEGEP